MSDKVLIGVIGGSGVYQLDGIEVIAEHKVETPFGEPSCDIIEAEVKGTRCYFLPRHGKGHTLLPHEVNYRANIYALKKLGVQYILSLSAVGSLREECPPTTFVLPDQFIDWTKGGRKRSFFGEGIIGHVSVANPIEGRLQDMIEKSCKKVDINTRRGGTYVCIEGPQFSSRAESHMYRSLGADIIGMTNVPEAYLAKEAGMAYATVAMVTDFDCWKEEHCTVEEIMKVMSKNTTSAQRLLEDLLPELGANLFEFEKENRVGVMTPLESLSDKKREIVEVLLS